eukprot:COSAG05_NODE_1488_length_4726_cov_9.016641_5_plen_107_part_00
MLDHVEQVFDALKASGAYETTVIIYTSDNGAQGGQGGSSYPLKGWKTQLFEGGVRVPGWVHSPLLPRAAQGTVSHVRCLFRFIIYFSYLSDFFIYTYDFTVSCLPA